MKIPISSVTRNSSFSYLWKLINFLPSKFKTRIYFFLFILFIASLFEIFAMFSVVPFLSILSNESSNVVKYTFIRRTSSLWLFRFTGYPVNPLWICIYNNCLIRFSYFATYLGNKLSANIGSYLSFSIYSKSLYQDYQSFSAQTLVSHQHYFMSSLPYCFCTPIIASANSISHHISRNSFFIIFL